MPVIDKLFVSLGYEYDEKKLKKFNGFVSKTSVLMKRLAVSAIGVATALGIMALKVGKNLLKLEKLGGLLGIDANVMAGYQRMSQILSGSETTAADMLQSFKQMSDLWRAGIAPPENMFRAFADLGIDFARFMEMTPEQQFNLFAKKFRALNKQQQGTTAALAGLGPAAQNLLLGATPDLLNSLTPTSAQIEKMKKVEAAWARVMKQVENIGIQIGDLILDPLENFLKKLDDFLNNPKQTVNNFFESEAKKGEVARENTRNFFRGLIGLQPEGAEFGPPRPTPEQMIDRSKQRGIIERGRTIENININIQSEIHSTADPVSIAENIARVVRTEIDRVAVGLKSVPVA